MTPPEALTIEDLSALVAGDLRHGGVPGHAITNAASLEEAGPADVSFLDQGGRNVQLARESKAGCLFVSEFIEGAPAAQIRVGNPKYAFALALGQFRPRPSWEPGVHEGAYVSHGVELGDGVTVMTGAFLSPGVRVGAGTAIWPGVFIGHGSTVGRDCTIYPNVVIMDSVTVGDRVIIHPSAILGADGYGFVFHEGRHVKIPQVGCVEIGDDVELGACACIDRATTGKTVVGRGSKIDNAVQVAHNVTIGEHVLAVAQTGIAGSTKIGSYVVMGGQTAIADHAEVADGTVLAGRSGVITGKLEKGVYGGTPVQPHREWLRSMSHLRRIHELVQRVGALEEALKKITSSGKE